MQSLSRRASAGSLATPVLVGGRYRVEAALGKGGAAQVYRAVDLSTGHELALKRLAKSASQKLTMLFELEYQTLASLKHPRIVEAYEYGRDSEGSFYTMELLAGEDLKDRAPITWREACRYLRDAALALSPLHARKLVHRDVSPRNLWRTPDGRVKLIDFGALAPFGTSDHLIGTPPLVPPEACLGQELDQRSDLYSLGAVAYYLITGLHAFPARDMRDLPALWQTAPERVSQRVAELQRSDLESVPPELDALIESLLSRSVLARPISTGELVDRIDALIGNPHGSLREGAEAYMGDPAFIGRARERHRLRRQFALADAGRGQSCLLESAAGMGRSRALRELALQAQVTDATVLHVDAAAHPAVYGVAEALACKLLDTLPVLAREAAAPYAATLVHISPRLRERLAVEPSPLPELVGELRVRIQAALRDWFLAVASKRMLVVLVDGLELTNDVSGAFLLTLARELEHARILLVCAHLREPGSVQRSSATLRALCEASRLLTLRGLDERETYELLHSVFGRADNLERLSARLHRATGGNPGYMLELSAQLVRHDVIGFVDGTWVLPQEIPDELLSSSREQALAGRVELLSEKARELGSILAVHAGALTLEMARDLASSFGQGLFLQLGSLLEHEIMTRSADSLRFAQEAFRTILLAELTPERTRQVQQLIGEALLSRAKANQLDRLNAGVYLLESGDPRGPGIVAQAALTITINEGDSIASAVPQLELALARLRAQGRPRRELIALLAPLAIAGYYADRRLAARYGEITLATLQDLVGLSLARVLRPYLGRLLGLVVALVVAGVRLRMRRKNPCVPTLRQALMLLFNSVATLSGTSAICLDPKAAARHANVLEPFTALGKKALPTLIHEYSCTLSETVRDAYATTYLRWQRIVVRLESGEPIQGMPESLRIRYLGGALYASGVMESQCDGERALRTAERLDGLGLQLYQMSADQIRTVYYANQGNLKLYEHYRGRAEQHAIQQGTIWQVENWMPSTAITASLRTHDAMTMKRASEQLSRLAQEMPSFESYAKRGRGTYLLLRKRYEEALPWLERCLAEEPRLNIGWARAHGALARAYNRTGQHAQALAACARVDEHFTAADYEFVALNLIVQTEQLIARSALGEREEAFAGLESLIARHAPGSGPLTMGQLHEAGLQIALLGRDEAKAEHYFRQMERWYTSTGVASLAERCEALGTRIRKRKQRARRDGEPGGEPLSELSSIDTGHLAVTVHRLLGGGAMLPRDRAHRALQLIAEPAQCTEGHLFLLDEHGALECMASLVEDRAPDAMLLSWLQLRLESALEDEQTQLLDEESVARGDDDLFEHGGRRYRALMLLVSDQRVAGPIGVVLLGSAEASPPACSQELLGAVSYHLQRDLRQTSTSSRL